MITKLTVAICDICGYTEKAKCIFDCRNENDYVIPDSWQKGKHENVHICPSCAKKLNIQYRGKE